MLIDSSYLMKYLIGIKYVSIIFNYFHKFPNSIEYNFFLTR